MNDKDFLDFLFSSNILMDEALKVDFFNLLVNEGGDNLKLSLLDYFNSLAYKIIVRNDLLTQFNDKSVTPLQFIFDNIEKSETVKTFIDNNASKYVAKFVVSEKLGRSITEKIPDAFALEYLEKLTPLNSQIVFGMITEESEAPRKILVNQLLGILKENISQAEVKNEYLECSICKDKSYISSLQDTGSEALKDIVSKVVGQYDSFSTYDDAFKSLEESVDSDVTSQANKDSQKTSWLNWLYNFISFPFKKIYQYLYPDDKILPLTVKNLKSHEVRGGDVPRHSETESTTSNSSTEIPNLRDYR